jgi:hypothetical protein
MGNVNYKSNKILIFSSDNRQADYIDYHNANLEEYSQKYGYNYIFHDKNIENVPVYWSKLIYMKMHLESNKYDYVMWLDTDANIINDNIRLNDVINKCTVGKDNIIIGKDYENLSTYCAGVFIIKNSKIGRKFINQCIDELKTDCVFNGKYDTGKIWAGLCYEQGRMNKLIRFQYLIYTTIVSDNIFRNTYMCNKKNVFILHKYGGKDMLYSCFEK